jgi:hypothetical protein
MNALFGDATTAMPTPASHAERGSLMGVGSPSSIDIRAGGSSAPPTEFPFSANDAIPGLDIDPPDMQLDEDGKPIRRGRGRNQSQSNGNGEGFGGWIGRMVSRSRQESGSRGQYGKVGQDEEE